MTTCTEQVEMTPEIAQIVAATLETIAEEYRRREAQHKASFGARTAEAEQFAGLRGPARRIRQLEVDLMSDIAMFAGLSAAYRRAAELAEKQAMHFRIRVVEILAAKL